MKYPALTTAGMNSGIAICGQKGARTARSKVSTVGRNGLKYMQEEWIPGKQHLFKKRRLGYTYNKNIVSEIKEEEMHGKSIIWCV
ncbi:hypothetical protein ABE28_016780 [Peribacillus muralis]|uniref:Uncharacterized protein n=1 Tax=Peribacillus muralis TaxID=264697 RepID=A0A1B3XS18_9BACI|nr:hypothetical protein ABE28_016780 [Peribacillus muralis]